MWAEIVLAFTPTVMEAIGAKILEKKSIGKVQRKLNEIICTQFECFADSSLDTSDFYRLIQSSRFIEIIRNYFFMVRDNLNIGEYRSNIENIICDECKTAKIVDVREFINRIESLYIDYLCTIIENYPSIYASFQLMSISHREILSRIHDNRKELERYLVSLDNRKATISDENIKQYHSVAEKEFSEIRFTGIAGAERRKSQSINEFYVENTFSYFGKEIDKIYKHNYEEIDSISLENFFDLGNKIILIGGAGLGKSTTLNYLFCNYEELYDSTALKLKIDLKDYAEEIGEKKKGILWCIANEFSKRIKYSGQTIEDLQSVIANRLNAGSCLIILDALDEIPTQALRNSVRNEIETFTSIYYLNRFIISTREAGYLRNRFDDTFLHIKINLFDPEQIEKYSRNWYLSYYEDASDFDDFWSKFYNEVERARCINLIRNPIVLVLALVIFDFESSLPTRRIEFYQKCIDTFLTERENRKAAIKLDDKTKSILAMNLTVPKIAFYKYSKVEQNVRYKFNYSELKEAIMEAISVEDKINWLTAVNQYSEYLVERTELLQEKDEDVLDFAHKTFYEYFLAFYFSKMTENQDLVNLLKTWIGDPNYDELARLIVEVVIQNNDPKQHDCIMDYLFEMLSSDEVPNNEMPYKQDIFSLVADLYTHNLLQPKYQYRYNNFVLYNPHIVDRETNTTRHRGNKNDLILYDPEAISKMFLMDSQNGKLIDVLDALYFLNNEFKKIVIKLCDTNILYHINALFSALKNAKKNDKSSKGKSNRSLIDFFMGNGLEFTLAYPQVFMSITSLMIQTDYEASIDQLFNYKFTPRSVFYYYTSPDILRTLATKAMNSKLYFALFLTVSTECAFKQSNSIYAYIICTLAKRYREDANMQSISEFYKDLWKTLNNTGSFDEFKKYMLKMDLYDQQYDNLYRKTYSQYLSIEKPIQDKRLKQYILE